MRTQTYIVGAYWYVEAIHLIEVLKDHPAYKNNGVCLGLFWLQVVSLCARGFVWLG